MAFPVELTLSAPGLDKVGVAISRFSDSIKNWREFWIWYFSPFFWRLGAQAFETEGAATGEAWAPLSPRYAAWKAKHFPGAGILERTGALKKSMRNLGAEIWRVSDTTLEIGTAVPYALFHQVGTRRGLRPRPVIRFSGENLKDIGKLLHQYAYAKHQEAVRLAQ